MIRIYFAALVCVAIFLSYFIGIHVGNVRCNTRIAESNIEHIVRDAKIMEKTNEVVYHTGTADVRRILHEKYTIAE